MKGFIQGKSLSYDSTGIKNWRSGDRKMTVSILGVDNWSESSGIEVVADHSDWGNPVRYDIFAVCQTNVTYKNKVSRKLRRKIGTFNIDYLEQTCPLCRKGCPILENGVWSCNTCDDLNYTEDSISVLSEVDEMCKALKNGMGLEVKKLL